SDGTKSLGISGFGTLQAGSGGDSFTVTAPSTFNLKGGTGADVFDLGATLTGTLDGGAGNDTLKGSQITDVTLTGSTADGFSGMVTAGGEVGFTGVKLLAGAGARHVPGGETNGARTPTAHPTHAHIPPTTTL